jgi:hypothetical protein
MQRLRPKYKLEIQKYHVEKKNATLHNQRILIKNYKVSSADSGSCAKLIHMGSGGSGSRAEIQISNLWRVGVACKNAYIGILEAQGLARMYASELWRPRVSCEMDASEPWRLRTPCKNPYNRGLEA